ncbi:DUF1801 domain-containing protein [Aestuariispira ectoiniformans]|uniref:DUF1801 domain-containing protein n=1 Tax=Aestuariispira ectoiniformans TaxID=2775080 RepID=UPI00223BC09E|nr:DUF1801 domain-containing protein [Aestuariispira ectoiniformans]
MTDSKYPFADPAVEQAFDAFPSEAHEGLLQLRSLIFEIAAETEGVGPVQECLKWGQPAYLTPKTKSGTTIRLGLPKQGGFALYTHCQTTVMAEMRDLFPDDFTFEGKRAVHFTTETDLPLDKLTILIRRALTYHQ